MSVRPRSGTARVRNTGRSPAGNVAFGAGLLFVLTTMVLGGYGGVTLSALLADHSSVSSAVPAHGRDALLVGGLGGGGLTGLLIPLILFAAIRGTATKPRLRPGEAFTKVLATLAVGCYLLAVSLLAAQAGRMFPETATTALSVLAVGFGWVPLALLPWERFGLKGWARGSSAPSGEAVRR